MAAKRLYMGDKSPQWITPSTPYSLTAALETLTSVRLDYIIDGQEYVRR